MLTLLPPALRARLHRFLQGVDYQWLSPESGDWWHKSRQFKTTMCSFLRAGGCLADRMIIVNRQVFEVSYLLHFESSLDALRLRSDVITSMKNLFPVCRCPKYFAQCEQGPRLSLSLCARSTAFVAACCRVFCSPAQIFFLKNLPSPQPSPESAQYPQKVETYLWQGYHESRRCSRDTYSESYVTKCTSIRRLLVRTNIDPPTLISQNVESQLPHKIVNPLFTFLIKTIS